MATNNQINSPVKLPTSVGTNGQAILSDGAGNSAWGSPASSPFFNVSGSTGFNAANVTLLATFMAGRIITNNNIGPCLWTADTAANYSAQFPGLSAGDTIQIFVSNLLGASISFNPNTGVNIATPGILLSNGSILLRFLNVNSWDLYVV